MVRVACLNAVMLIVVAPILKKMTLQRLLFQAQLKQGELEIGSFKLHQVTVDRMCRLR